MRRLLVSLLCVFTIVLSLPADAVPGGIGPIPEADFLPGELILKFRDSVTRSGREALLAELGAERLREFRAIGAGHYRIQGMSVLEALERFGGSPQLEYIEPNYRISYDAIPDDTDFELLWGLENTGQTGGTAGADISATDAWEIFTGSSTVLVAVVDSGTTTIPWTPAATAPTWREPSAPWATTIWAWSA